MSLSPLLELDRQASSDRNIFKLRCHWGATRACTFCPWAGAAELGSARRLLRGNEQFLGVYPLAAKGAQSEASLRRPS